MTDHRVTDLSYGHLGKASYDPEENEWKFSVELDHKSFIQQLTPFKEWHPPSIRNISRIKEPPSVVLKSQRRWLSKARPEMFLAGVLASNLSKEEQSETSPHIGSLLAVGRAVDPDRVSGSRTAQILAVPHGDAGHILRLIKARVETRGWGKRSAARLTLLESESPEYGHWVGEGGAIRQILAADSDGEPGAWLAVRQDTATTIFRPQYGRLHPASTTLNSISEKVPVSQLNPNPVATLTTEKTQSRMHADVAFNPWYARQFAVVDTEGVWSIWDLEKLHSKNKRQVLVPVGRGGIYDKYESDLAYTAPAPGSFDGWYKILWVCNISTVVVCNRRHLAVVDLSTNQSRLQGEDIVLPKSHDWVLDIKRSRTNESHLFVLTTSRIFWVEVTPKGEGERALGLKVLLSYRHFKNADDETMKLVVLNDEKISVLITSSASSLVLFYYFGGFMDPLGIPTSCQGSFSWSNEEKKKHVGAALSHLCFLPLALTPSTSVTPSGPGLEYMDNDVKFFQVWALGMDLEMSSTLCVMHSQPSETNKALPITAPTSRVRKSVNRLRSRITKESFIVQDGMEDEDDLDHIRRDSLQHDMQAILLDEWQNDLRFRINWRRVYRQIFGLDLGERLPAPKQVPTLAELFIRVSDRIHHGIEDNEIKTGTFAEISGFETISEDIEEAAEALRQFFRSLDPEPNSEAAMTLVVSNLAVSAKVHPQNSETHKYPDLSTLYDQMAEYWMTSLPQNVSNWARVARYRVIRQLAIDVCLSSVGISIENKLVSAAGPPHEDEVDRLSLPTLGRDSRFSRDSSPTLFSSQLAAIPDRELDHRLPTPAKTPSLYSHATSASDPKEDPAISRLRQYAPSMKAELDIGSSRLRSEWKPGADPYQYSYQEAQKARAAAESGDESEHRNRKEEARRRRRTEKFLRQERSRAVEAAAQSMFMPSGSQPAVSYHFPSSQTVDDVPMTQPELGTFGSRVAQKGKKKSKKPRTAGFR